MGKMLKTSPEGRKCLFPRCPHILSIYNHNTYCHVHLDQMLDEQKRLAWGTIAAGPSDGARAVVGSK